MIINMSEVNVDNVHDWSISSLEKFRDRLSSNIDQNLGKIESQKLLRDLIVLEIDRQNRIKRINSGAELKKEKLIRAAKGKGVDIDI